MSAPKLCKPLPQFFQIVEAAVVGFSRHCFRPPRLLLTLADFPPQVTHACRKVTVLPCLPSSMRRLGAVPDSSVPFFGDTGAFFVGIGFTSYDFGVEVEMRSNL